MGTLCPASTKATGAHSTHSAVMVLRLYTLSRTLQRQVSLSPGQCREDREELKHFPILFSTVLNTVNEKYLVLT